MPRARLNPLAYAHIVRRLQRGRSTEATLAEASGLSDRTVRDFMRALEAVGAAHVVSWAPDSRGHARFATWAIGKGESVPPPVGESGMRHRAAKLAQEHGCAPKDAYAVLRATDGDMVAAGCELKALAKIAAREARITKARQAAL